MNDTIPPEKNRKRLKLIGLLLLLGLTFLFVWGWYSPEEIELFVPIHMENMPEGLIFSHLPLKEIEIRLSGPKYLFHSLSQFQNRYVLDLSDVRIGINRVPIEQDRFLFPKGFRIENIIPPILTLKIENLMTKRVPVMVSVSGKPAAGYVFVNAVAKPPSAIVSGPESILEPMDKVMTKPIDINGFSEFQKKEIALDLTEMLKVKAPSDLFLAEIFIEKKMANKAFHQIPVEGRDTSYPYSIAPEMIDIEISGPVKILERLEAEKNIKAYVDLKDLEPGVYVRPAIIALPLDTILINVNPEKFTITIQ